MALGVIMDPNIFRVEATDDDEGRNANITYSIKAIDFVPKIKNGKPGEAVRVPHAFR